MLLIWYILYQVSTEYEASDAASADQRANEAFSRLFAYIDGANENGKSANMHRRMFSYNTVMLQMESCLPYSFIIIVHVNKNS